MKRNSIIFLQIMLVLIAIGAAAVLLWEPHVEGVNAQATSLYEIYFDDPFLAYVYVGSVAFFTGLYQAFKLLGFIANNKTFSTASVKALRKIKYCALIIVAFLLGAEAFIVFFQRRVEEDIAGGVMLGLALLVVSSVIATVAAMFEKLLQNAIELKSENDLTV